MDNLFLVLRVVVSLAVVLGLLYVLRRRLVPHAGAGQRRAITVVARQGVGAKASVALVDVAGRRYLLGVGDQSVSVLDSYAVPADDDTDTTAEDDGGRLFALSLDDARHRTRRNTGAPTAPAHAMVHPTGTATGPLDTLPVPATRRDLRAGRTPSAATHGSAPASPLAGSILSAQTWRQAAAAWRRGPS